MAPRPAIPQGGPLSNPRVPTLRHLYCIIAVDGVGAVTWCRGPSPGPFAWLALNALVPVCRSLTGVGSVGIMCERFHQQS